METVKVSKDVTDITPELFEPASGREIKQSKLRVVFVGPPKPPSPVPEGIEEEASPVKVPFKHLTFLHWVEIDSIIPLNHVHQPQHNINVIRRSEMVPKSSLTHKC